MYCEPDVYGKKAYRDERDAKILAAFLKKKTINEISASWGLPWNTVKKALEREARKQGIDVNFRENLERRSAHD